MQFFFERWSVSSVYLPLPLSSCIWQLSLIQNIFLNSHHEDTCNFVCLKRYRIVIQEVYKKDKIFYLILLIIPNSLVRKILSIPRYIQSILKNNMNNIISSCCLPFIQIRYELWLKLYVCLIKSMPILYMIVIVIVRFIQLNNFIQNQSSIDRNLMWGWQTNWWKIN